MARAYLAVDVELASAFLAAQEDKGLRWLKAKVEGEAVRLVSSGRMGASIGADFDALQADASLAIDEPAFVLFSRDAEALAAGAARSWQLVCWVPDSAAPRLKMIYSSSREDLKGSLGGGFFSSFKDYCANDGGDMAWSHVAGAEAGGAPAPLTDKELFLKEEQKLEKDTRSSVGMASVPFRLADDLEAALRAFVAGEADFVEAVVGDCETLKLAAPHQTLGGAGDLKDALSALDAPRFLLVAKPKPGGGAAKLFVYYCPESAPVKAKMTYSTAKATFADILAGPLGVDPEKTLEVRDAGDLQADVDAVVAPPADDRAIKHAANSKPKGPGRRSTTRGSAKLKKWTPEG
ncbi:hypothetical protein JL720_7526 [Aureococcus anophagefferens]|uniref:Expressed protein n=1 Tax=Aureococcus anophagefferens TaxID=44056 RepID=F0Y587_AURAN|nr:expressed protein [Aureococcus anophagefferens]EGB09844.1 expressed protein [Aureococcus anophagefferens]KAH8085540.1 hypothetical protein JL720_7526 [Aureococcus anophagefferens]|eukprot:XP_009035875.1 expressed protein [Aureococcus anophagefferens]